MAFRQPKPCKTPGCGKLTHSGLCIECRRKERASRPGDRRGAIGFCIHCGKRIFEPFSIHLDKCANYRTWSGPGQSRERAS